MDGSRVPGWLDLGRRRALEAVLGKAGAGGSLAVLHLDDVRFDAAVLDSALARAIRRSAGHTLRELRISRCAVQVASTRLIVLLWDK